MKRESIPSEFNLGFNMAAGVIVFACLGYWIGQKNGQGQFFTLLGIFLGLFYGGYQVWRVARRKEENEKLPPL